jgi:hypothetical protein
MASTDDRREHARFDVFAGNAQIVHIVGPSGERRPTERARILNWSRGGVLLKVPSPQRRFLFFRQEPIVRQDDMIKCVLRLPPLYADMDISGEVVRVTRCRAEPDHLEVGLSFVSVPPDRVEAMAKLLEPRKSARLAKVSGRAARKSQRVERTSGRVERTSGRAERVSGRSPKKSQRLAGPPSERRSRAEPTPSQRLNLRQKETLELRSSARLKRA